MKSNPLSEYSIEELHRQQKTLKSAMIGIAVVLILVFCVLLYLIVTTKKYTLAAILPASMLSLFPVLFRWKQLNHEIKSRK
ncbi:hypothetical protein [Gynurincola endophyticus]|uniref:hypothetical protein n=1 Tax=Gynurincola endophyticus TaxID=2479004 RepID=UPI000F8F072E|nr:hypothetical protein [Gynurincola endophyticus]